MRKLLLSALMVSPVLMQQAAAQNRSISGRVTDTATGQGLPGVTVLVKGTTVGASTTADGSYTLNVPATATTLSFSFIGYAAIDKTIGDASSINAELASSTRNLDEVVVTGLATNVKRSNLANNIATISAQELIGQTRSATVDGALQGKLSGAVISQSSGAPGGGVSIQLRGPSSIIGSSEPLYIIDGIYANNASYDNGRGSGPFTNAGGQQSGSTNRISDINPDDIESIEVLKGASAAAMYGTRANAGVIIITTKKGKAGQTRVSVRQDIGVTSILRKLGHEDWTAEKIDKFGRLGGTGDPEQEKAALAAAQASGKIFDYEEELFGSKGMLYNTSVNVSGGSDKIKYFASGSRTDEGSIQKKLGFQRNSIRANVSTDLTKNWDFSLNSNYINSNNQRGFNGNNNNDASVPWLVALTPSYADLHANAVGQYPDNPYAGENPLALRDLGINNETTNRFLQSFTTNLFLLRHDNSSLRFSGSGGIDYTLSNQELYLPETLQSQRVANPGASRYTKNEQFNTNLQAALVYTVQVGKLGLTTQAGIARITSRSDLSFTQGEGLQAGLRNPGGAKVQSFGQTFIPQSTDLGYFVQEEANFADRIVATVGLRADQSNLYGNPKKAVFFPKGSLAVNLANFDFWTSKEAVSLFKPRVAYGETGGAVPYGSYFNRQTSVGLSGTLGTRNFTGIGFSGISPERATELEGGFDAAFLNNRITLEATAYRKKVKNFLNPFNLASSTGVTQYLAYPVGDLENRGVEIGLGFVAVDKPNFRYTEQTQFWFNRSEVTRLDIPVQAVGPGFSEAYGRNYLIQGESPTRWFGFPIVNGKPTAFQESQPKFQVSFANNLTIMQNIELSFLVHIKQGGYNSTLTQDAYDQAGTTKDFSDKTTDADGNTVNLGDLRYDETNILGLTQRSVQDASYMKLREVSLYYTIPKTVLGITGKYVQRIKFGVSGNNLVLVTPYKGGYDPEVSNFGSTPVGGYQDLFNFPSARRMFFHLNLDF